MTKKAGVPSLPNRRDYISRLIGLEPSLASASDLTSLPDTLFDKPSADLYNTVDTEKEQRRVAKTLSRLIAQKAITSAQAATLVKNLTGNSTAGGYLAQMQAYEWFLDSSGAFDAEIHETTTLNPNGVDLDGRIRATENLSEVFFDVKSFGFADNLIKTVCENLRRRYPDSIFQVDGPLDCDYDDAVQFVMQRQNDIANQLEKNPACRIQEVNWTVRRAIKKPGVTFSEQTFGEAAAVAAYKNLLFKYSTQFTTKAPFVLVLLITESLGSSIWQVNFTGFTTKVTRGIASYAFIPSGIHKSPVDQFTKIPLGISVGEAISYLSGFLVLNIHKGTADLHVNRKAKNPLDNAQIAASFRGATVTRH